MGLLRRFVRNDLAELHQNNVRVRIIGERVGLDPDIDRDPQRVVEASTILDATDPDLSAFRQNNGKLLIKVV